MEYVTKQMQTYRTGKTITDQFYIDDDYNVPDAKSDVKRVILGEGTLAVEDMKIVENYIRVAGKLNFKVLYVTDEGETRLSCLEGRIPFEEMIYLEQDPVGDLFIQSSSVDLTVTAIHSRKLNLKTLAEISICSEGRKEAEITTDIDSDTPLYKRHESKELLRVFTTKKDTYRIKEEVSIGGTKENIGTLLWTEVNSRKLDTRLEADELKLQGELLLFCFYESLDGKTDWIEQTIPYEGRIECYGVQDNMYHQIYPELTDVNIDVRMDEDGEMRLIGVEATLEVRLIIYEEEQVDILSDIYSLEQACTPRVKEEWMEQLLLQNHSKCKVTEQLSLPEIKDDILQICLILGTGLFSAYPCLCCKAVSSRKNCFSRGTGVLRICQIIPCILQDTAAVRTGLLILDPKIHICEIQISGHCDQDCKGGDDHLIFFDDFFHIILLISFLLFLFYLQINILIYF